MRTPVVERVEAAVANLGGDRKENLREMRSHYLWRAWKQRGEPQEVAAWVLRARIAHALLLGRPVPPA